MIFWRTIIFSLVILWLGFFAIKVYDYRQLAELKTDIINKVGSQHLVNDAKNNTSLLTLCIGQKWLSGVETGFNGISVSSANELIATGSFLSQEPLNMAIEAKGVGVTKVTFEVEIVGITKAFSYFQVTVEAECAKVTNIPENQPQNEPIKPIEQPEPLTKTDIPKESSQPFPEETSSSISPISDQPPSEIKKDEPKSSPEESMPSPPAISNQPKSDPKKDISTKSATPSKKTWQFPEFSKRQYYRSGEEPECELANGDISYDTATGSRQPLSSNIFYLKLAPQSWWSNRLQGQFLINKITSSDKKIASTNYNKKHGLVIKPNSTGTATITIEAATILDKKPKIDKWPEIKILVEVPEPKMTEKRLCPGEIIESLALAEKPQCKKTPTPKKKPEFSVAAPPEMSKEAEALANQIITTFKKIKTLPKACEADIVSRQAKKVAAAFYKIPKPPVGRSCVDCAQDVANVVVDALADEEVACIEVTKVGRKMFDTALHTAAVIGPPCAVLTENSLVIDTWYFFFAQKFPGVQNHRVYEFYDWINEYGIWWDYIDWGAGIRQSNVPMKEEKN